MGRARKVCIWRALTEKKEIIRAWGVENCDLREAVQN